MVFSSTVFLFLFLPVVLGVYLITPRPLKNTFLLIASLFFYAWGERFFVLVMLASITLNYVFGLLIDRYRDGRGAKIGLALAVIANLALLFFYKYANFFMDNVNVVLSWVGQPAIEYQPIHLPIGISFFTFQAMSYVIDVYRREVDVQKNPFRVGLYVALFPQLIAGPIVRYIDVAAEIAERSVTLERYAYGIKRFVAGLAKKILIANIVAVPADGIFNTPANELTVGMAWLGIFCFFFQLYYDFSGYSDMAIGLGHMFGFRFLENFNYPYISRSMTEFWQRWHISLSTWFRDYLYIPLGGNSGGALRSAFNVCTVFLLCGLWHGASWNFAIFGFWHGIFLVLERKGLTSFLNRLPIVLRIAYVWFVVQASLVLFRAEDLPYACSYFAALAGFAQGSGLTQSAGMYVNNVLLVGMLAAVVGSSPILPALERYLWGESRWAVRARPLLSLGTIAVLMLLLAACMLELSATTHNPFIYFQF